MPSFAIDKLLTGKPEQRKRFEQLAADPGVSGDRLMGELHAAGFPATRTSTYRWKRQYRRFARSRPDSVLSAVVHAVMKLGRGKLYELARELGVRTEEG